MTESKPGKPRKPKNAKEPNKAHRKTPANKKKTGVIARSVLNAVIGDQLARDANPMGIKMQFRQGRNHFSLAAGKLAAKRAELEPRLVVLLHGLSDSEQVWEFPPSPEEEQTQDSGIKTYGSRLAQRFAYTPLYLRYNTGRPIEENGAQFAQLMQELVANYPRPVTEILLIGHSMGGLVLRHAQHVSMVNELSWLHCVSQFIYIGSPHEGADLERVVNAANKVLSKVPWDHISIWSEWIDFRSAGIKDLDRGVKGHAQALEYYGLYPQVQHNFISGSLGAENNTTTNDLLGDSLVRRSSAQPQNVPENCRMAHFYQAGHTSLTTSQVVYEQIEQWVAKTGFSPGPSSVGRVHEQPAARLTEDDTSGNTLAMVSGAVDLTEKLFGQVLDTGVRVNRSVATEVYDVLGLLPTLGAPVKVVRTIHGAVADAVNKSNAVNGKVGFGAAKWIVHAAAAFGKLTQPSLRKSAGGSGKLTQSLSGVKIHRPAARLFTIVKQPAPDES